MKFSATDKFLAYAKGAVKTLQWRVYVKDTTSLSEALSAGTWVEVTSYLDFQDLPEVSSNIEYEVGQFTADSIKPKGRNITFWKALFNTANYLELKIEVTLGQSGDDASDTVYTFSGFIDPVGVSYNELEDSVTFEAYTADELGSRIAAENISTQYINTDIDGSGTDGLAFHSLPGLYVKDANISSYVLKVGTHTLTYDYNNNSRRARLDNGMWVPLANGNNTLGDGAATANDTERLKIYVPSITALPTGSEPVTEKVIVITAGDTLPKQWYRYISVKTLLGKIFEQIGITTVTYDTLNLTTWDGNPQLSFMDYPPADDSIQGPKSAIIADATDLYVAVGHKMYKRTSATGAYSLLATMTSGDVVSRLLFNAAFTHLWIYYGKSVADPTGYIRQLILSGPTLSSEIALANSTKSMIEVMEGGTPTEYSIIYVNTSAHSIMRLSGTTPVAPTTLFSQATLGYTGSYGPQDAFAYKKSSTKFRFLISTSSTYETIEIEYGIAWVNNGSIGNAPEMYKIGAYHSGDGKVYYYRKTQVGIGTNNIHYIYSHPEASNTPTLLAVLGQWDGTPNETEAMLYTSAGVYFTTRRNGYLYKLAANVITQVYPVVQTDGTVTGTRVFSQFYALTYLSSVLYGLDDLGKLFQYGTTLAMYVPNADFTGKSVRDALNEVLNGFMLVQNISSQKTAALYRRGDASGTPLTSGNTLAVTVSEADQLEEVVQHSPAADYVEVGNGVVKVSYDGTTFDANVLSTEKKVSITSGMIPDELVKHVCYHAFQFFGTARNLYRINLGCIPLFQYEVFDAASITFAVTKIVKTGSGPIYAVKLQREGGMVIEVLI